MPVNKERLIDSFLDLVKIGSPSRKERLLGDYLIRVLRDVTDSIQEDDIAEEIKGTCGNIIMKVKGTDRGAKKPLVFVTHTDTVTPCDSVKPLRKDGMITSDGKTILGADDKAGIAAVIELLRIRKEQDYLEWCDLVLIFTVGEETGLLGSKRLDVSPYHGSPTYVLDAVSAIGTITNQAPFGETLSITITGKAAHAGAHPERGKNAILMSAKALTSIPLGRIDPETTANIGKIHGGQAINIVPDHVRMHGEIRSQVEEKLIKVRQEMLAVITRETQALGGEVTIEVHREYNGFCIAEDEQIVNIALRAAENMGKKGGVQSSGGGSDANVFNEKGLQAVVLGVGYEHAHTKHEQIAEESLYEHAKWIYEIARVYSEE